MQFEKYQRMIQKVAHNIGIRYSVDFDEMEAQGYLIYCECVQKFDITKASFSTYLYINLTGRLKDFAESYTRNPCVSLDAIAADLDTSVDSNPCLATEDGITQDMILDTARDFLSEDGYSIFQWILGRSWERKGRRTPSVEAAMKAFGWTRRHTQSCWDECRDFWRAEGAVFC